MLRERRLTYSHSKHSRGLNQPVCKDASLFRFKNLQEINEDLCNLAADYVATECLLSMKIAVTLLKAPDQLGQNLPS